MEQKRNYSSMNQSNSDVDETEFHEMSEGVTGITNYDGSIMSISVFMTLGIEVHEQMFRSGGQSDSKSPVFSSQASLVLILSTHCWNERLSRPCPAWG
ncbi:hypothetical protein TNCV_2740821 [Trichonephila clavipes]|nr:hypothetical protein TNCV_2740821 [Trichonephila clavipes]